MARGRNASISYETNGIRRIKNLWVTEIAQPLNLSGAKHQSRLKANFYPRAHAPGNIEVKGRCKTQEEYQELALFIRKHHRALMNTPVTEFFSRIDTANPGYRRLLRLMIPSEDLFVRGWIDGFAIRKRGVLEVAPEFSFNFFVVFDYTAVDITVSHRVAKYYEKNYSDGNALEPKAPLEQEDPQPPPNIPE